MRTLTHMRSLYGEIDLLPNGAQKVRFLAGFSRKLDTFLDQGSRSERYLQIKAHFEV